MSPSPIKDDVFVHRLERLCDAAVRIESFAGSEKEQNPLYKDYHGEGGREGGRAKGRRKVHIMLQEN